MNQTKFTKGDLLGVLFFGTLIGIFVAPFINNETYELNPEINLSCPDVQNYNLRDLDYRLYEMEMVIDSVKNYSYYETELNEFLFLQMVLNKFSTNQEYDKENYNCQHFARDIDFIYESLGYDVTYNSGYNDGADSGHMWNDITISIDATSNKVGYFNDQYDFSYSDAYLSNLKVVRDKR